MRKRTGWLWLLTALLWFGVTGALALQQQTTFLPFMVYRAPAISTPVLTYTPPPVTPTYTPPAGVDPSLLPIVGHTSYTSPLGRHIVGEVENRTTFPVGLVTIRVTLYDAQGNQLGMVSTLPFAYRVPPGERACFNLITPNNLIAWSRYELTVLNALGPLSPRPRLTILDVRPGISPFGTYTLSGKVRNDENYPVALVVVFGTLYDRNGNILDCARPLDVPTLDSLAPGATADFTITFGQPPTAVGSYRVEADGDPATP